MWLVSGCLGWRERDGEIVDKSCCCSQEQSDRPDTFSRLTPNSWLLSEKIRPFQAMLKPHTRAGGEACQGTLAPRRASRLPTKQCFTFGAAKTHCKYLINDISRIAYDGRGLIPIKSVPAPRPKSPRLCTQ